MDLEDIIYEHRKLREDLSGRFDKLYSRLDVLVQRVDENRVDIIKIKAREGVKQYTHPSDSPYKTFLLFIKDILLALISAVGGILIAIASGVLDLFKN